MSKKGDWNFLADVTAKNLSREQLDECLKFASTVIKERYDLITSGDWKVEKITSSGNTISCMILPKPVGKIFKITATLDIGAKNLMNFLYDGFETSNAWHKIVARAKVLYKIDDCTMLTYAELKSLAGGAISPRDFVDVQHRGQHESYMIVSYTALSFELIPSRKNFVRGKNGLSCYAARSLTENKCEFTWMTNTDFNGWIPQKLIDGAVPISLNESVESLKSHLSQIKK